MVENDGRLDIWRDGQKPGAVGSSHHEHPQNDNPVLPISRPTLQNFIPLSSLLFSKLFIFVSCVFSKPQKGWEKNVELKWWEQMGGWG